jgi:adhesin/invasin
MRIRTAGIVIVLALVAASACGGDGAGTSPGATVVLTAAAGIGQKAAVGALVAIAPAVTAMVNSQLVAAVPVTFTVTGGGGSVTTAIVKTDSTGTARVGAWTMGTVAGANTLTASVTGGTPVTFTATALAGSPAVMTKSAGDGQTAAAGSAVATKPAVLVTDQFANPVAGVDVSFALAGGGGSTTGVISTTGANGIATLGGWTLGTVAGVNTLTASANGFSFAGNSQTFVASGVAGPVATLTKVSGDNQSTAAGTAVSIFPAVRLADQFGNLVFNQSATFTVASGGGSVAGAVAAAGPNGIATVGGWTLGALQGANSLTASSGNAPVVTFVATATAGFNAAQYAGTYTGNWNNTTDGTNGTASATVTVNGAASTVSLALAVTGPVLGIGGVTTTQSGLYTANGASVSNIAVPVMGTVTFTVDAVGNITASGTNIPNALISNWSAVGTVTSAQVRMNYTVTYTNGSTSVGTIALNHN